MHVGLSDIHSWDNGRWWLAGKQSRDHFPEHIWIWHMCSGRMPPSPTPSLTWSSHQVLRKSSLYYKVKVSLSLFKLGMCFLSCSGHGRRYLLVHTRRYWFHMRLFVRTFVTCFLTRTCVNLCFRSVRPGDAVKNIPDLQSKGPEFDFGRKLWGLTWLFRCFEDNFSAIYSLLDETLSRFLVHRLRLGTTWL